MFLFGAFALLVEGDHGEMVHDDFPNMGAPEWTGSSWQGAERSQQEGCGFKALGALVVPVASRVLSSLLKAAGVDSKNLNLTSLSQKYSQAT